MSFSRSVIAGAEQVLHECFVSLEVDEDFTLICVACAYWEDLLLVGEHEFPNVSIDNRLVPSKVAAQMIEKGMISRESTSEEWQDVAKTLIQKLFVLGLDHYGETLRSKLEGTKSEEYSQYTDEEVEDDD